MDSRTSINLVSKQRESDNKTSLGVWVYTGLDKSSIFKRFDNINDAIKEAIKHTGAYVLQNGKEITYGKMDGNIIYYKTPENKVVITEV